MDPIQYGLWKQNQSNKKAKKEEKREVEKEKLDQHVMGWVVPCGQPGQALVYFGPAPNCKEDLYYLRKKVGIRAMVSLKQLTGRKTRANAFDTSIWYAEINKQKKQGKQMSIFTAPFDTKGLSALNDEEVVEAYVKAARDIKKNIRSRVGKVPIYIHLNEGFEHEGYIAMALWRLESGRGQKTPLDPVAWLKQQKHDQVFKMTAQQELMQAIWKRVQTISTGISAMFAVQREKQKKRKK